MAVAEQVKMVTVGDRNMALSELPTVHDIQTMVDYAYAVEKQYPNERGTKTFVNAVSAYVKHVEFAEVHRKRIVSSHNSINGFRSPRGPQGSTTRGKRSLAVRFYNNLGSEAVRGYCDVLNVDHDAYNTVDERFAAMAQAQHPDQP